MRHIPSELRRLVISRAGNHCEYCSLDQRGQEATFHVDHIHPVTAGGQTISENLALACVSCSLRKASRQVLVDVETGTEAMIFNPRIDKWTEHFSWNGERLVGLTPTGRA